MVVIQSPTMLNALRSNSLALLLAENDPNNSFFKYTQETYSSENYLFYICIEEFKDLHRKNSQLEELKEKVKTIHETYYNMNSELYINLDYKLREDCINVIEKFLGLNNSLQCDPTTQSEDPSERTDTSDILNQLVGLLCKAQSYIYTLLRDGVYYSYKNKQLERRAVEKKEKNLKSKKKKKTKEENNFFAWLSINSFLTKKSKKNKKHEIL